VKKSENMKNKTLVEDRLDGSRNFSSWKSRLQITLEEDDLLSVIQKTLPETTTDEEKEIRKEEDIKARKIIIYSVRDHLLPRISNLKTTYEMYEALKNMFESAFLQSISGREKLPTFDRLWIDCTQEKLRLRNRGVEDSPDDNHALTLHTNKG
jgi:hypothetical protein